MTSEPVDPVDPVGAVANAEKGGAIITASWVGTGLYVIVAVLATIFPDGFGPPIVFLSVLLFAIGSLVFLWAYAIAVQRSRTDLIGIGGLYFLAGTAPNPVRFKLLGSLAVEFVVAIITSSIRLYSATAFGFLVPVYGLALCGLWGARYGTFAPRTATSGDAPGHTYAPVETEPTEPSGP
jgi:hypothetical protein